MKFYRFTFISLLVIIWASVPALSQENSQNSYKLFIKPIIYADMGLWTFEERFLPESQYWDVLTETYNNVYYPWVNFRIGLDVGLRLNNTWNFTLRYFTPSYDYGYRYQFEFNDPSLIITAYDNRRRTAGYLDYFALGAERILWYKDSEILEDGHKKRGFQLTAGLLLGIVHAKYIKNNVSSTYISIGRHSYAIETRNEVLHSWTPMLEASVGFQLRHARKNHETWGLRLAFRYGLRPLMDTRYTFTDMNEEDFGQPALPLNTLDVRTRGSSISLQLSHPIGIANFGKKK
ncbi:MAG: hypothetical protein JJT94_02225 [Bernardetiaceae bacterium]|nr:hypothetical protein [Bernardetiaceae bacterium]